MKKIFFIRTADVMKLEQCSGGNATRKMNQIRNALGKRKGKPVTIREYCEYNEIEEVDVKSFLQGKS